MAKQLHAEFYSQNGLEWDIELYNDGFVGTSQEVTTHDLQISWSAEGDTPLEPLKTSRASFSIVNNSAAVDTFISNMKSGNEDDFQMVIYKGGDLYWAGVVLVDLLSWDDAPKNRVVTIQAIDGIGRLKGIPFEYASDTLNPDTNTLLKYVYEILEYNNLSQYWGASDAYFLESCEFYDTNVSVTGGTNSPFLLTRAERTLFLTNEISRVKPSPINKDNFADYMNRYGNYWEVVERMKTLTEYKPISCYDALAAIMQLMCCRIMIDDGSYHIQQIRNFNTSTYTQRRITKSLTVSSSTSYSHRQTDGTDVDRQGGGRWTYETPLNIATVLYTPPPLLRYDGGTQADLDSSNTPVTRTVNIGTVRGGSGTGRVIRVVARIRNEKRVFGGNNTEVEVRIEVKCGSYRLSSPNERTFEWKSSGTHYVTRTYRAGKAGEWLKGSDLVIEFFTPEIPFTKETGCTIDFRYTISSVNASAAKGEFTIKPEAVETLIESSRNQAALFEVLNPNTQNSKRMDFGNLGLVDRDDPSTAGNIEIYDGTNWVESGVWTANFPNDYTLHQTVPLEAVALQRTPADIYQGTIFVPKVLATECVFPHKTYYYDSITHWFNGGTMHCTEDKITGEWVQLTFNTGALAPVENKGAPTPEFDAENFGVVRMKRKDEYDRDWWDDQQLAAIKTNTGTSATTSISVVSLDKDLKDGDTLTIIDPYTNDILDTCTVNGDQSSGATSITVNSFTPSEDLYVGCFVCWDKKDIKESEVIRAKGYLITTSTTVPTAGSPIGADGAILNPDDGNLYYDSGGSTYKVTGTLVT